MTINTILFPYYQTYQYQYQNQNNGNDQNANQSRHHKGENLRCFQQFDSRRLFTALIIHAAIAKRNEKMCPRAFFTFFYQKESQPEGEIRKNDGNSCKKSGFVSPFAA